MEEPGRAEDQRLRAAVESAPSGLIMVDSSGRLVLVNREIERMFGYRREELLGQPIEILVPEPSRPDHPHFRRAFVADPRVRAMGAGRELFGRRKDGTQVPVEIGLTPVATEDGLFVLGSVVDITARVSSAADRRKLEEQLRQSQKLEALGTLAGGVAHEFNNLLAAIVGYAELVRDEVGAGSPAAADLDALLRSTARGKDLVSSLLRFSRQQKAELRPTDLGVVVGEATRLLQATLPAAVEIRLQIADRLPRVLADPTSVHQVVINLATNSAHAMPTGGALDIDLSTIYARDHFVRAHPSLKEGPHVRLSVRDSGIGMDEAVLGRAFEPFFTTKPAGVGTGLGLSIVDGIVREHHGAVVVESQPGRGTTVECYFPAAEPAEEAAPAESADELPRGHGERILYVDDEATVAAVGERRLRRLGYEVIAALDPRVAIELVRADPARFDAVITDLSMPQMSGVEVGAELQRIRPGIRVILASGYAEGLAPEDLRRAGVRAIVGKPFSLGELAKALRELLAKP